VNNERPNVNVVGVLQILTMLVGISTVLWVGGAKTEQLARSQNDIKDLAAVVNDLAKAQASAAVADATHTKTLEDIHRRLTMLENRK
jgi:hypothetical protein